jgi:hypothetical protein
LLLLAKDNSKDLCSDDNGFLDDAFGDEWEIVREPSIDTALERANPGDSFSSQQQRHTGAGRFVGSRAVENDVAIRAVTQVSAGDWQIAVTTYAVRHCQRCRWRSFSRGSIFGMEN